MPNTEPAVNPHFAAYASANGRSASAQLTHDRDAFPGGVMTGFILWLSECERAFRAAHPECYAHGRIADLGAWTRFVERSGRAQ